MTFFIHVESLPPSWMGGFMTTLRHAAIGLHAAGSVRLRVYQTAGENHGQHSSWSADFCSRMSLTNRPLKLKTEFTGRHCMSCFYVTHCISAFAACAVDVHPHRGFRTDCIDDILFLNTLLMS